MLKKIKTKEEFIERAKLVHGDKYDYSHVNYINSYEKVCIICPKHGEFWQSPKDHLRKRGCPKCGRESTIQKKTKYNTDNFIKLVKEKFDCSKWSFEHTQYKTYNDKITITCHEVDKDGNEHGDFEISPSHLLNGQGCPKCRYIKSSNSKRRSLEKIKSIGEKIHCNKYDYSLIEKYTTDRDKYPIICPQHGVFYQNMNNHLCQKQGCPICGRENAINNTKLSKEEFINRCNEIHNNRYDYSNVDYKGIKEKICIICPIHGEFWQTAANHSFLGEGCLKCYKEKSKVEQELLDFIKEILPNEEIIENDREQIKPKEIDVYIPSKKIGFEMNGVEWHSQKYKLDKNYHLNKTKECLSKGIRLIQIFDDEWNNKREICKSRIRNILNKTTNHIFARKCQIKEIEPQIANKFLNENHIQGVTQSQYKIGLYYNNELVSLMTFGKQRINLGNRKQKDNTFELIRFCNKLNTNVVGGASKLLSYFIKKYRPNEIISYADRRWSNGNLYEKLGFNCYGETAPNYFYIVNRHRKNRFNYRKDVLVEKYGCPPNMTETVFCKSKGWYRIYDCGCLCYKKTC